MGIDTFLEKQKTSSSKMEDKLKELTSDQRRSLFKILETVEVLDRQGSTGEVEILLNHYYDMLEAYKALGYDIKPYLQCWDLLKN